MFVEAIEAKLNKKEAMKYILKKTPLVSKVVQFNNFAKDVHIEYIEFKILSYEITTKGKVNGFFRHEKKKKNITILVNTYSGYSQSIENIPDTYKKYIAKSCIKTSRVNEDDIIENCKNQIISYLEHNSNYYEGDRLNIQDINIQDIKSIFKPYWVADFNGKAVFIDA